MLIAESNSARQISRSLGFSLGEAARIRRDVLTSKADLSCPRCASELDVVGSRGTEDVIWITTCSSCKLSLVVHRRAGDLD